MLHRVDELSNDQQGRVTGVVVDIFEALVHNAPVVGGEHVYLVALALQQLLHHAEVDGQHLGHEEGILLLHLLGEQQASGIVIDQFSQSAAAPLPAPFSKGAFFAPP